MLNICLQSINRNCIGDIVMEKSENIDALAKALSGLQGEVKDIIRENQGYGYKYGDLSQVLEVDRPLLSKYNLALPQFCESEVISESYVIVKIHSTLMHESGQWMASTLCFPVTGGPKLSLAQNMGIVITYGRRYARCSLLGIAQTDNDAADLALSSSEKHNTGQTKHYNSAKLPDKPNVVTPMQKATKAQVDEIIGLVLDFDIPDDTVQKWNDYYNIDNFEDLTESQATGLIAKIKEKYGQ